mmetsp:Transcript_40583/g.85190  ORF Transcript_40583/g.85190 Transcript_40583/m.85190 type:complete len:259 (-) Transcript_40583:171-947(-)
MTLLGKLPQLWPNTLQPRSNLQTGTKIRPRYVRIRQLLRTSHHSLQNINFGTAPSLPGFHPIMSHLRTRRNLLRMAILLIALIVTVRPNEVTRPDVRSARQIPQHPKRGPQSSHLGIAGELGGEFDDAAGHAEFVPALDHARLDVFGVGVILKFLFVEGFVFVRGSDGGDVHYAVGGLDVLGTVEVQCFVCVIIFINGCPSRIRAVIKGTAILFKFIGEYQLVLSRILRIVRGRTKSLIRRIGINPSCTTLFWQCRRG